MGVAGLSWGSEVTAGVVGLLAGSLAEGGKAPEQQHRQDNGDTKEKKTSFSILTAVRE